MLVAFLLLLVFTLRTTVVSIFFSISKSKDTAMVIIKNHDSSHVWGSELAVRLHCFLSILTFNFNKRLTILATKVRDANIEMFIILKYIIIQNFKGDSLFCFPRAKSQSSNSFNIITLTGGSSIFSLIIHLNSLVHVSTFSHNGYLKSTNRFHDSVVGRIKHQAAHSTN